MKTSLKDRLAEWVNRWNTGPVRLGGHGVHLRLPRGWPEADPSAFWWGQAGAAESAAPQRVENLAQLPSTVRAAPVHVWTPAAETLLARAKLPTRSRARILQALPYALEDQLLDEPEALHFAYVREADGSLAVAVTRRARLNIWLEILKGAGLRPASLCPGNLALPLYPQAWSAAFVDEELWVRSGEHAGLVTLAAVDAPPPLLVAAVKEAAAQDRPPQSLVMFSPPARFDADAWSRALQLPVMTEAAEFWQHTSVPTLNLLQADFGHAAHVRQLVRPLTPAIVMLVLWLIATVVIDVAEWIRLRHLHRTYIAEMREIYRQSFGTEAQYPYDQMRKSIEALQTRGGGPADLLPLLTRIAPTLQAQQPPAKLHSIKYAERSLTLELAVPNYQALDVMKNALQAANLDVEVLAANGRGNEVDGRLRVQPHGAKAGARQRS